MSGTIGAGLSKSRGVRLTRFFLRESNFAFLRSMAWPVWAVCFMIARHARVMIYSPPNSTGSNDDGDN
jgi:hypothetical protein